jgi:20S proteasome subunit beta 2
MAAQATDFTGREVAGFCFENVQRNATVLKDVGLKPPKAHKTGTTICGLVYAGGVVLGADTRATEGSTVCDKNCEKIHHIAPNIWCCGAGTSADTENTTEMVSRQLKLLRMETGKESRVVTAMTRLKKYLFRYQGHVSAALVLGGVDCTGPHLYTVWPHGSTDKLPYVTMGSGSLCAMAVFEAGYKDNLNEAEAKELVRRAILSGIWNDLGSGGNVDLMVLRNDGTRENLRNLETPNEGSELRAKVRRPSKFTIGKGTTTILKESVRNIVSVSSSERDVMDVSK